MASIWPTDVMALHSQGRVNEQLGFTECITKLAEVTASRSPLKANFLLSPWKKFSVSTWPEVNPRPSLVFKGTLKDEIRPTSSEEFWKLLSGAAPFRFRALSKYHYNEIKSKKMVFWIVIRKKLHKWSHNIASSMYDNRVTDLQRKLLLWSLGSLQQKLRSSCNCSFMNWKVAAWFDKK